MRFLSWDQIDQVLLNKSRQSWTPTVFPNVGSVNSYTINEATYLVLGNTVDFFVDFTITDEGTASSDMRFTLPIASTQLAMFTGNRRDDTAPLLQGMVLNSSTTAVMWMFDQSLDIWENSRFTAVGRYRIG